MSNATTITGTIPDGEMISFKLEKKVAKAARKLALRRIVSLSQWLREAAREKMTREITKRKATK